MVHPVVEQMGLSEEQRPAVLARGADVLVTAGAGTGKTRSLVARYLSLAAEGFSPRTIAAITFTHKAAREMRNRVREEMQRFLEGLEPADDQRARWAGYFAELDAARIGTIHSLCAEILRGHPAEAELDPRFEVLEEGQANILRAEALDAALAWAADHPDVVALFDVLGEYNLRQVLGRLLRDRLNAAAAFDDLPEDILAFWRGVLEEQQGVTLAALLRDPAWQQALAVLGANAADEADDRMELQRRLVLTAVTDAERQTTTAGKRRALSAVGEINLSGGRMGAWPGGKEQLAEVKAALKTLRECWRAEASILDLELNQVDIVQARHLPHLRALFAHAAADYQARKDERNALDFDDLEEKALDLLLGFPAVRSYWQERVQAVLVDEFQDTNGRQRNLVLALCERPGKRFIVGDAKQSIYRFRGADVTVFRAEQAKLERSGGALFALATSYRAHRDLIQGLNDLLAPVLGSDQADTPDWVAPFAPLSPHREAPYFSLTAPFIELHLTVGSKGDGALDRAAAALAGRVAQLVAGDIGLTFGDVAVLCRASTSFGAYEDAFDRAGIPFLTVAGRGFYHRPEIRDVLNALQALSDPTDDLALVGLLRSPACALSDQAIYQLAEDRKAGVSLWATLQKGVELHEPDAARARRAAALIAALHRRAGRATVADLLKAFLDETAYLAALIQSGQPRAVRNVDKLLADALASNMVSIGDFLAYVTGLRDSGTREGEARTTREGAVQIMSVHAAKGLEFPVVVLGDITYNNPSRSEVLLEPAWGVLLPQKDEDGQPGAMYKLGQRRHQAQEEAESDRLLYVAATRAKEMLLLNGCFSLAKSGRPRSLRGWLKRLSDPIGLSGLSFDDHDENGSRAIPFNLQAGDTPLGGVLYEPGFQPPTAGQLPETSGAPAAPLEFPPPLLVSLAAARPPDDTDQDRPQRVWQVVPDARRPEAPAWLVGVLVHEALAAWRFPGPGFDAWAKARARGHGLTDRTQHAHAARRAGRLLARFRDHALFQSLNGAERRLHEVPYSLERNGKAEHGIIDVLYLEDGVWTVVDFKTDHLADPVYLGRLLAEKGYEAQVRRYGAAVGALLGRTPRGFLCLLDVGNQVVVRPVAIGPKTTP